MSEPPHVFLSLPCGVRDRIMGNLSPLDFLNLARVDKYFFKFVYNYPKQYKDCVRLYGEGLAGWNNDPTKPVYHRYYYGTTDDRTKEILLKDRSEGEEFIFIDGATWDDHILPRYQADLRILYNNATIDTLDSSPELLDLNITTTIIYPSGDHLDTILEQIRRFSATELYLQWYSQYIEGDFARLFSSPIVRDFTFVHLKICTDVLPLIAQLNASRMEIWNEHSEDPEGDAEIYIETVQKLVEEWLEGSRKVNILKFRLPISKRNIPDEITDNLTDPLNEKYNLIAKRLAENHQGGFVDSTIDGRFKLIKRKDGKGLFVFSGITSLCIIECDYQLRSRIGLAEDIGVVEDVDSDVLQRENNINQLFLNKSIDDNLYIYLFELTLSNRTWPEKAYKQ